MAFDTTFYLIDPSTGKYEPVPLSSISPYRPSVTEVEEGWCRREVAVHGGREFSYLVYYEDAACTMFIRHVGPGWNDICEELEPGSNREPWRKDQRRAGEYTTFGG